MNGMDDFERRLRDGLVGDLAQVQAEGGWRSVEQRMRRRPVRRLAALPALALVALLAFLLVPKLTGNAPRRITLGPGPGQGPVQDYDGWKVCAGHDGGTIVDMVEDAALAAATPREAISRHVAADGHSKLAALDYVETGPGRFAGRDGRRTVVNVELARDEQGRWWVAAMSGCTSEAFGRPKAPTSQAGDPRSIPVRASTAGLIAAGGARDEQGRTPSIHLVEVASAKSVYELTGWAGRSLEPIAFSPDGGRLLYSVTGAQFPVWRVADFQEGTDTPLPAEVLAMNRPVWDGPYDLLVQQYASVDVVDTRTMRARTLDIAIEPGQSPAGIAAGDGYRFAVTIREHGQGALQPVEAQRVTVYIATPASDTFHASVSPQGIDACENPLFYDAQTVALVCRPFDPEGPYRTSVWTVKLTTGSWTRTVSSEEIEDHGHIVSFRPASGGGWLIQWSGECEVPAIFQIGRAALPLRRLFPEVAATTFGSYSPARDQMVIEGADDCGGEPRTIVAAVDGSNRRTLGPYVTPIWSPAT
jgi:hypothetical protein